MHATTATPADGLASSPPSSKDAACRRALSRRRSVALSSAHLAQLAGLDLIDEASHGILIGDEGAGLDAGDRLTDVLVEVLERLGRPLGLDAGVVLDRALELVV